MHQEDIGQVYEIARAVAKEEIAKVLAELKPVVVAEVETPKPVEVEAEAPLWGSKED